MPKKFKKIRKWKYRLFKAGIHKYLPGKKMKFFGHLCELSSWISEHRDLEFSDFPSPTFEYKKRFKLHDYIIKTELRDAPIDYLEFGVSKGESFRRWIDIYPNPESRFYGFDTFTGLPEDWGPFKKGDMSGGNEAPVIDDSRHTFFQGVFQQTLLPFLKDYKSEKKKVIHMDADLYSATLFVLTSITPYLRPGDVILFDEFNVPLHESRAFFEWVESFYINYTVLGEVNNYYQVAIRIEK